MATTQRVVFPDGSVSTTVLDGDLLPCGPAEDYLAFLRLDSSPNTVRAYAHAIALWLTVVAANGHTWDQFPGSAFGDFLRFVKTGDTPGTARIGPPPAPRSPATVRLRGAAVLAFYQWQAAAHGVLGPYQVLFSSRSRRRASRYVGALTGIADRGADRSRPLYRVRSGPRGRTPVLLPAQ
ncbi:MAG: tyrosine-type recombinase/integrase, partial [Nakamurella sp.]